MIKDIRNAPGGVTCRVCRARLQKTVIGEYVAERETLGEITGVLDKLSFVDGVEYDRRVVKSTHVFLCGAKDWIRTAGRRRTGLFLDTPYGDFRVSFSDMPNGMLEHAEVYLVRTEPDM